MIARLRSEDLAVMNGSEIAALGRSFMKEANLVGNFNLENFIDTMRTALELGIGSMWVDTDEEGSVVGSIGGVLSRCLFTSDVIVSESFWYVLPDHRKGRAGIRLFSTFMDWCRGLGAKRVLFSHIITANTSVEEFYEKNGFKSLETIYVKELK